MKLASQIDPHGISASMGLRQEILALIKEYVPYNIIETGTYHGLGTTSAVLHGLHEAHITGWTFVSIESNKRNWLEAKKNLSLSYDGMLHLMHANSIPKELMPKHVQQVPEHVITDHRNPDVYLLEVPTDIEDDGLMTGMKLIDNRPDLVILDSAGHLGFLEFEYVCRLAESSFVLVLDDTLHRKHYDTLEFIRANPFDFQIMSESKEKFGHAIVYVK